MSGVWDGKERRVAERRQPTRPSWDGRVRLNGKNVDLLPALPLCVGDWKSLKNTGISMKELSGFLREMDLEKLQHLMVYVAGKVGVEVKPEAFDPLTMLELVDAVNGVLEAENQEVNRPT